MDNTRGNTPALHAAIQGLDALAGVCVLDERVPADSTALAAKRYILELKLQVYLGVSLAHIPWSSLKIIRNALDSVRNSEAALSCWHTSVTPSLELHAVTR